MSMPAAHKTTSLVHTFISGLSPLLRTANQAARSFELFPRRYRCVPSTTRLEKYCPPRYRARSGDRKGDEKQKRGRHDWVSRLEGGRVLLPKLCTRVALRK